jgi:hypothetical protein
MTLDINHLISVESFRQPTHLIHTAPRTLKGQGCTVAFSNISDNAQTSILVPLMPYNCAKPQTSDCNSWRPQLIETVQNYFFLSTTTTSTGVGLYFFATTVKNNFLNPTKWHQQPYVTYPHNLTALLLASCDPRDSTSWRQRDFPLLPSLLNEDGGDA